MLAKHNSGGGNIEHITGLQCCTPIDDLLPEYFRRCLAIDLPAIDNCLFKGVVCDRRTADEIDLSDAIKDDLEGPSAICLVAARNEAKLESLGFWIQKGQILGITDKQINVVTITVPDLQHEGSATTECPVVHGNAICIRLIDDCHSLVEKLGPSARVGGIHQDASGSL